MDKDREDVLNELIEYYDKPTVESESDDTENIGDTRVIKPPVKEEEPAEEETLGDTVVVKLKNAPKSEPEPVNVAQPVQEEVLGNLDISGKPIDASTIIVPPLPENPPKAEKKPVVHNMTEKPEEKVPPRCGGVWYSLKPLWVTLILCAVAAAGLKFYITDDGIIGTYKRNFNYNMGLLCNMLGIEWNTESEMPTVGMRDISRILVGTEPPTLDMPQGYTEQDNVYDEIESAYKEAGSDKTTLPFADADSAAFAVYGSGVVCAKSNYLCYILSGGEIKWETETAVSNPIMSICGKYIAIASEGGRQVSLYNNEKFLYCVDVPNTIRSCNVSENGDIALITDKPSYKGAVILVNSKGELVFSWSSGVNYITSAAVLKNRRIAVSLVSAEDAVTSYVMMFDIKSTNPLSGAELQDTLIYRLGTNGRMIYVNGDNSISYMNGSSGIVYDIRYDDALLTHSATDSRGYRLVSYIQNNIPAMNLYRSNGSLDGSCYTESVPDYIDVYKSTVLYNSGQNVICGGIDEEKKTRYAAPRRIKRLVLINASAYMVVYEDGLELIRI